MRESATEVAVIVAGSAVLFAVVGWPFARLARADHLIPRWLRQLPLTVAVLLLILTAPTKGALR